MKRFTGLKPSCIKALLLLVLIFAVGMPALAGKLPKDFFEKLEENTKIAAEQGDAGSQVRVGYWYETGDGVIQDYEMAVKWYKLAAEQGYYSGLMSMAEMYWDGKGVVQDNVRAHMWYNLAAVTNEPIAEAFLKLVENEMTSAQIAKAQRLARECVTKNYKNC